MPPETSAQTLLDIELIATLRLERSLSERAVARALGVSPPTVGRLEAGAGHRSLTIARLLQLAELLGAEPAALLTRPSPSLNETTPDEHKLQAALLASRHRVRTEELAEALGWTLQRTTSALRRLARSSASTGAALTRTGAGWQLGARDGVLTRSQRQRLERVRIRRHGLTLRQTSLMRAILDGQIDAEWERKASNADRVDLAVLLRAGYATRRQGQITAADEVTRSLAATPNAAPDQNDYLS
jgi:transcriptional regulator with XRE-family HTH domain